MKLNDTQTKAIDNSGKPDKQSISNKIEKFEWEFVGDTFYDGKTNLKGKPLAKDSFGHQIVMYFKNGKLIGQVLHNDISLTKEQLVLTGVWQKKPFQWLFEQYLLVVLTFCARLTVYCFIRCFTSRSTENRYCLF
ncbi:MAG: hypothetical protein U5K51_17010 [Flavobacteriaceae bacterium]|nr:hypothetical protein [Flavobacteriaceae bacterium]